MRRILVVDDDLHTRRAIRTWLKRCGVSSVRLGFRQNATAPLDISKEGIAAG